MKIASRPVGASVLPQPVLPRRGVRSPAPVRAVSLLVCALVLVCGAMAPAAARTRAPAHATKAVAADDGALLIARDAYHAGDDARLARATEALSGSVLQPWAEWWQVRLRLDDRSLDDVLFYLNRYAGSFLADQLRRDWLKSLAKKGDWARFREQEPALVSDDRDMGCYRLQSRWLQNADAGRDAALLDELRGYWTDPRDLPDGCLPLVRAQLQSGRWGAAEVWTRFRLLAEANQTQAAKDALASLTPGASPDARLLAAALDSPIHYLERPHPPLASQAERELYMAAVLRVSRSDPQLATSYWDAAVRSHYAPADNAWLLARVAMSGARRLMPDALHWYADADAADPAGASTLYSDEQLAWRVRIALRQQDWPQVQGAIEHMSLAGRSDPAWLYWLGRALKAQAGPVVLQPAVALNAAPSPVMLANALFSRIAGDYTYYGRLAAEELGRPMALPPAAPGPTHAEMAEAEANPGLARALALYRLDMRAEAAREWLWSIRGMDDRALLAAAELARRNELWDRAIGTADRTIAAHDFKLRYLAPYRDILAGAAHASALDEPLVLALVRQESRFVYQAKSGVGASGLMQLMPATAKWVAHKIGLKGYSWQQVHEPQVNATLGTFYLKQVLNDLNGCEVLAAAAYNAGPGRARKWRDPAPMEGAVYVESIPFNETRDYVKKVMINTVFYSAVLGGETVSLKGRLGIINPDAAGDRMAALRADPTP